MSLEQKQAWLIVGAFAVSSLCFLILIPLVGVQKAQVGFAVFAVSGLGPLLFRKKADPAEVPIDERDKAIFQKVRGVGAMAAYLVIFVAWGIAKAICYHEGKQVIDVDTLGTIALYQMITLFVTGSIMLLLLYGRGDPHSQE